MTARLPPAEAVTLLDDFLTALAGQRDTPVFLISGNRDPAERLAFGGTAALRGRGVSFARCMMVS